MTGYLPDLFDKNQMTFSLMSAADIAREDKHLLKLARQKPRESKWSDSWVPFGQDGGGGYLAIDIDHKCAVVQYDSGSWQSKKCATSLASYLQDVASRVRSGKLKPFDLNQFFKK